MDSLLYTRWKTADAEFIILHTIPLNRWTSTWDTECFIIMVGEWPGECVVQSLFYDTRTSRFPHTSFALQHMAVAR